MNTETLPWYSQCGQDTLVDQHLCGAVNGVFVEVGAGDGIINSNTLFFERHRHWTGLLIEPHPAAAAACRRNRTANVGEYAICTEPGDASFCATDGDSSLSHLLDCQTKYSLERISRQKQQIEIITVETLPLSRALWLNAISHIDYLSVDTEGNELDVLRSINWMSTTINCISVENNGEGTAVKEFLANLGFRLIHRLAWEEIYAYQTPFYQVDNPKMTQCKTH
jgi:FkbM family methyltransferase